MVYNAAEIKSQQEKLIDDLMINEVALAEDGSNTINLKILNGLKNASPEKRRTGILSILDKDRRLFCKIHKDVTETYVNKYDHINNIVEMVREYVKVGDVEKKLYGEVMTPISLVNDMLDMLPSDVWTNPNLKWLDPCNGVGVFPCVIVKRLMEGLVDFEPNVELRYKHIIENMLYVCELQPKNMFLFMFCFDTKDEYDLNIYNGSYLDEKFDKYCMDVWGIEKFDIIVGNPPYNQMIDMLFVQKSYMLGNTIMFVQPSTFLLDEKNKQKKFTNTKELIKNHLESITLFNGNKLFGVALFVPCCITVINKNKKDIGIKCVDKLLNKELIYDDIYQINKFSDNNVYPILKNKIFNKTEKTLNKYAKELHNKKYWVNLAQIRGNVDLNSDITLLKNDFYTLCTRDLIVEETKKEQAGNTQFSFDTENEANNFLSYVKTNFARFCFSMYKNNQNIHRGELDSIPFLDFTKKWDDFELYKLFNLTELEIKFIEDFIPKYY